MVICKCVVVYSFSSFWEGVTKVLVQRFGPGKGFCSVS